MIHNTLPPPEGCDQVHLVRGKYKYYHYGCDGLDDRGEGLGRVPMLQMLCYCRGISGSSRWRSCFQMSDFTIQGWGCGYRTLQTLCSWVHHHQRTSQQSSPEVPGLRNIQKSLVAMGDKPESFKESKEWIGTVEVAMCIDHFYGVACKILHVSSGRELGRIADELMLHFRMKGAPVMMGGDCDTSSKAIMGVAQSGAFHYLLILDPHYYGPTPDGDCLIERDMLLWRPLESFIAESFYNMCLPQLTALTTER